MTGFEPATPTLARLCATNCATSACFERVRRSMRSTTIVHRSSAPQIPTPRPDLGRSVALIWRQRRGDDSGPSGTESTHLARCSAAWRKGVAHQKFPKLDWNRQVVCGHRAVRSKRLAALQRRSVGRPIDRPSAGTRSRAPARRRRQALAIPVSAPVRDNVPRRSLVIGRCTHGLVAQWESVRLTRGRSLVRYQPGPPVKPQFRGRFRSFKPIISAPRPTAIGPK